MTTSYRCWAEINPEVLKHNIATIRSMIAPSVKVMAIVKADAYGHGLSAVARLLDNDVDLFGVACLKEGQEIRTTGTRSDIVILSPALPDERPAIVAEKFIPSISTLDEAAGYAECIPSGTSLPIHFVIDTGMGRMGLWKEEIPPVIEAIRKMPQLRVDALASHLPASNEDVDYTGEQLARFENEVKHLLMVDTPAAVLNSAGMFSFGHMAKPGDIVRIGLPLYGVSPLPNYQLRFQPAMTLKTRVTLVRTLGPGRSISYGRTFVTPRTMTIATLGAGYGDGFNRHLSGQGADVLIRGARCPLLGRVTMDQIIVDVSHLNAVHPGDEVVLIGRQGAEEILATELATKADTIAWEIFTGITRRVTRLYQ